MAARSTASRARVGVARASLACTVALLHAQGVGQPLEGELRCAVDPHHRRRDQAAHRGEEDHAAPRRPEPRQHDLAHRRLADDVDLELPAQLRRRHRLDRAADDDPGAIDDRIELLRQLRIQPGDVILVGHIQDDRVEPSGAGSRQRLGVLFLTDARGDIPADGRQPQRCRPADAATRSRDQHTRHWATISARRDD